MTLSLRLTQGSLHYIPMALSTLKPSTSPHLSYVHLRLTGPTCHIPHLVSRTSGLENLDNDLRQVADELSRIEREYEGAVELIVLRSSEFELLNRLSVRFSFLWGWTLRDCCSFLTGPSALAFTVTFPVCFPKTGYFAVLNYSVMAGVGP